MADLSDIPLLSKYETRPLTPEEGEILLKLELMYRRSPESLVAMMDDARSAVMLIPLIEKRIEGFKLPPFDPSAILVIAFIFADGSPAGAVLSMIETLEAYDRLKPEKIDSAFICTYVYPWGIYTREGFEQNWKFRKDHFDDGYNPLIVIRG